MKLTTLDESLLRPLRGDLTAKAAQLYDNLWAQFGLGREERHRLMSGGKPLGSVTDHSWTPEVCRAFYEHPYHKAFVATLKRRYPVDWGMWVLNSEPKEEKQ